MENLTDILRINAETWPEQPAQRYWNGTAWQDRTYRALWETVQQAACGLRSLGVGAGDRVGLMAKTRPEWVIADYAILCLDAVTVPIYPSSTVEQIAHIVDDAGINWLVVENGEMAERSGRPDR